MDAKCDYCEREAIGWVTYEGLHRVCSKHEEIIIGLSERGVLGIDFRREMEKVRTKKNEK